MSAWPDKDVSGPELEEALADTSHTLAEVVTNTNGAITHITLKLSDGHRFVIASVSGGDLAIGELA